MNFAIQSCIGMQQLCVSNCNYINEPSYDCQAAPFKQKMV